MFNYDPNQRQHGPMEEPQYGDRLVSRVEAMQYNLAVQRGDYQSASRSVFQILGQWLWNRVGR